MKQAPGWSLVDLWERCGVKSGGILFWLALIPED